MTTRPCRVLVTGSRTWSDEQQLADALLDTWHDALQDGAPGIVVVHGACPNGADKQAADWCAINGVPIEAHPADWEINGKRAGFIRNELMVNLGADVLLAFIGPCTSNRCRRTEPHGSHGATGCAQLAADAGIPVRRWT